MRALVTGASGFVGSHLVELLLAQGWQVRVLLRRRSSHRWLASLPIEMVGGDITSADESLRQAAENVDVVFHAAGLIRAVRARDFMRVNAGGTANLVQACLSCRNRPARLVLVSSAGAQGPSATACPLNESAPARPITAYGRSKLEAERQVLRAAADLEVVIIRPGGIYGPRDYEFLPVFRTARLGLEVRLGLHPGRVCVTHVRDVAGCALRAASLRAAAGQVFLVGGDNCSQAELTRLAARVLGRTRLLTVPLPRLLVRTAGAASSLAGRLSGRARLFTWDNTRRLLARNWTIDASRAEQILGHRPQITLAKGLAETAAWYRRQGLL